MAQLCTRVILEEPAPLTALRPDVPPALADVIARCLRKDRNHRFASVGALTHELLPFARATASAPGVAPAGGATAVGMVATIPSLPPSQPRSSARFVVPVALVSLVADRGAGGSDVGKRATRGIEREAAASTGEGASGGEPR